jgi:Scaffold protein Nfu/NifU N terminal
MGQPITVVEKPSPRPGVARFETNRSLTGMGHERYASAEDILDDRPVDELARRLFATGGVDSVHVNSSVVTVHLTGSVETGQLLDVIRGLYIHYPQAAASSNGGASQTTETPDTMGTESSEPPAD